MNAVTGLSSADRPLGAGSGPSSIAYTVTGSFEPRLEIT
jgi:hypothetical protein